MARSMSITLNDKETWCASHNEAFYIPNKPKQRRIREELDQVKPIYQSDNLSLSRVIRQTIAAHLLLDENEQTRSDENNHTRPTCIGEESSCVIVARTEPDSYLMESTFVNPPLYCFYKRMFTSTAKKFHKWK
jgi:hypothetical protein